MKTRREPATGRFTADELFRAIERVNQAHGYASIYHPDQTKALPEDLREAIGDLNAIVRKGYER